MPQYREAGHMGFPIPYQSYKHEYLAKPLGTYYQPISSLKQPWPQSPFLGDADSGMYKTIADSSSSHGPLDCFLLRPPSHIPLISLDI